MPDGESPVSKSRRLRRPSGLADGVYSALYNELMTLRIAPGSRISVDSLAREMGVSQTPIREALSRLEAEGLVIKTHLIGYSAAGQMEMARFEQLYDLRGLLEPYAAGRAASRMSDAATAQLRAMHRAMQALGAESGRGTYGSFAQLDSQFHDIVATASGNVLVQDTLARLHTHIHLFRSFHHEQAVGDAVREHQVILTAIESGDADAASDAMSAHVDSSRRRFLAAKRTDQQIILQDI